MFYSYGIKRGFTEGMKIMDFNQSNDFSQNEVSVKLNRKLLLTNIILAISIIINVKLFIG